MRSVDRRRRRRRIGRGGKGGGGKGGKKGGGKVRTTLGKRPGFVRHSELVDADEIQRSVDRRRRSLWSTSGGRKPTTTRSHRFHRLFDLLAPPSSTHRLSRIPCVVSRSPRLHRVERFAKVGAGRLTRSFLNFAGRSCALVGMCKSPMTSTSMICCSFELGEGEGDGRGSGVMWVDEEETREGGNCAGEK